MKQIQIEEIENIKIGHATNKEGGTGCTVIICENGAPCGLDVRGGGPASRESELLKPTAACQGIHALLLSGGSAFGLDAAGGVMQFLEERNIGFETGIVKVPLVCESCIFDLGIGDKNARPDKSMGYEACINAYHNDPLQWGNIGAGCGASVGKIKGKDYAMKSGIGSYAIQLGELKIGAIVCVNAVGDVYDPENGKQIGGLLNESKNGVISSLQLLSSNHDKGLATNTTIGTIITNAYFDKTKMNKIAQMAQNGLARTIKPVHTSMDGDSIYAMSTGNLTADIDLVGTLATEVMAYAIKNAFIQCESAYDLPSYREIICSNKKSEKN